MTAGASALVVGTGAAVASAAREGVPRTTVVASISAARAALAEGIFDLVVFCGDEADGALAALSGDVREAYVVVVGPASGASDRDETIPPSLDHAELVVAIASAAESARLRDRVAPASSGVELVAVSKPMQKVMDAVRRAAAGTATVLLRGESGTGKELLARALHDASPRARAPFVAVHAAALPDALLESELFGHEKGAFTGAAQRREGRVAAAEGGTLFFDEVGELTAATQVKLLRLLQERTYEPLGSTRTQRADVRFVAATHRDLEGMVKSGAFREDLFYRLAVVPIWVPPLRARRDDIAPMARRFVTELGRANGRPDVRIDDDAIDVLCAQRWPGNVRELANLLERLIVLGDGDRLRASDVGGDLEGARFATETTISRRASTPSEVRPLDVEVRDAEKRAIVRALAHTKNNRALAARLLGVSRATLYNKLEEHGLG